MSKYNKRMWLKNRFEGLYPGVMQDLDHASDEFLENLAHEVDVMVRDREIDLNTDNGLWVLVSIVKEFSERVKNNEH